MDAVPVLVESILDKVDAIREVYHQKTCALALAHFVGAPSELRPEHLPRFLQRILDFCNATLTELYSDRAASTIPVFTAADFPADANAWTEGHRVQRMIAQDSVATADLKAVVMQKMQECAAQLGQAQFAQVLATVEPFVLEQLQNAPSQQR